jgi:hypothetical protein
MKMNGYRPMPPLPVGETVEQALRRAQSEASASPASRGNPEARWVARLAKLLSEPINLEAMLVGPQEPDGSTAAVWVRRDTPQTVEQALGQMHVPPPSPTSPAMMPMVVAEVLPQYPAVIPRPQPADEAPPRSATPGADAAPEDAWVERLAGMWKWIAAGLVVLLLMLVSLLVRAMIPRRVPAAARAAPAAELPSDAAYLAEIAQEIEGRCTTWSQELRDVEDLLTAANMDPVRLTLRADDVFAGTRARPRLLAEGRLRDPESPSPLRPQPHGGLTVKRFHDRPLDGARGGAVLRTIEASW